MLPKYYIRLSRRYYVARDTFTHEIGRALVFASRAAAENVIRALHLAGAVAEPF